MLNPKPQTPNSNPDHISTRFRSLGLAAIRDLKDLGLGVAGLRVSK